MPASIASRAVGSCGRPQVSRSTSVPLPRSSISGQALFARQRHQLGGRHRLGEALDGVVRRMDLHDRRGVGADRRGVVLEMRAVGRADLDQAAAGARHDVGNAEGAADLDQLAARDDDLAAGGQRVQHQQHGGGIVVDGGRRLGAGQAAQPGRDMVVALAAARRRRDRIPAWSASAWPRPRPAIASSASTRAPEIGVQHGAGQVEDAALRGLHQGGQPRLAPARAGCLVSDLGLPRAGLGPGAQRLDDQRTAGARDQRRQRRPVGHAVDGGRTESGSAFGAVDTRHGSVPQNGFAGRSAGQGRRMAQPGPSTDWQRTGR